MWTVREFSINNVATNLRDIALFTELYSSVTSFSSYSKRYGIFSELQLMTSILGFPEVLFWITVLLHYLKSDVSEGTAVPNNSKLHPITGHESPEWGVEIDLYSFFNLGARLGWVVNATPRPPYPRERPGTHCTGGWVGPGAGLDGCGKSCPHRDSIAGPFIP